MPPRATDMQERLAKSALEVFSENGLDGATLDDIAERAGVTKGSLYHHYDSKKDLILASCRYYYRRWHRMIRREAVGRKSPSDKLGSVVALSVKTCLLDRGNRTFTTEIFALSLVDKEVRHSWAQFYDAVRETYIGLLCDAVEAGELTVAEPRRSVDLMLSAMEGIKQRACFEPEIANSEEQTVLVADLLGILGTPNQTRGKTKTARKRVPA